MCKKINDFREKTSTYRKYVAKDKIEDLFSDIKTDSVKELTRIIANDKENAKSGAGVNSRKLISFIEAELSDREIRISRWSTCIITIATVFIAVSSIINLYISFKGQ